jgi:phage FluMu protein gp41
MALETTEPESTISPLAEPDSAMAPVSVDSLFSLVQPDTVEVTLPDTVETALDTLSAEEKDSFLASKDESRLPYDKTTMEITAKDSAYIDAQAQRFLSSPYESRSEAEIRKDITATVIDDKKVYEYNQNTGERLEHAIANLEKGDRAMAIAQRNILDRSLTAKNVEKEADIDNPQNMKDLWRVAKRNLKTSKRAVKHYPSTYANDILQLSKTVERMRELDMNPAVAKEFKKLMKVLTSHTQNLSPEIVALIEDLRLPTEGLIDPFTGEPIGG